MDEGREFEKKKTEITRTIYRNREKLEQFLKQNVFYQLIPGRFSEH